MCTARTKERHWQRTASRTLVRRLSHEFDSFLFCGTWREHRTPFHCETINSKINILRTSFDSKSNIELRRDESESLESSY